MTGCLGQGAPGVGTHAQPQVVAGADEGGLQTVAEFGTEAFGEFFTRFIARVRDRHVIG